MNLHIVQVSQNNHLLLSLTDVVYKYSPQHAVLNNLRIYSSFYVREQAVYGKKIIKTKGTDVQIII
jgi:hypothetical protein